jgi:AcrR family transcriptional regulator
MMKNEHKEDLRITRTKLLIKNSFIELAKETPYPKINVKDLCDKAMINRNTFYLHYQNKDDLVKEMINDTILKYKDSFLPLVTNFFINIKLKDIDGFAKNIASLLSILYEDIELFRIILSDDYLSGYFRTVEGTYEKSIISFLNIRSPRSRLVFRYIMSGCAGILTDWIIKHTVSIDETSELIAKLVIENLYFFNEENRIINM